ncbi:M14 family metallopeptidase [Aliikangiella sp. IMCC44359]|uniref:M14 family metallopeptidase n=1 Tax=Aliikangiella sp. IMCC44359 TaxID=3459125 RepID=UPI00403AA09E
MPNKLLLLASLLLSTCCVAQELWQTPYEKSGGFKTAHYDEGINFYQKLAEQFDTVHIQRQGMTDSGLPLHLVLFSPHKDFDVNSNKKNGRNVLLVNNAIHPGEPDGVDASMMLLRDLVLGKVLQSEKQNLLLAIIPFYNIGGVLNRNSTTRVNQNGPLSYGFRGNAKNYDLNRDFIKSDTQNSRSFADIFHKLDPDMLIDTHVSNGADYPYVMTLDYSQKDKMGGVLGNYINSELMPYVYQKMKNAGFESIPYVNAWRDTPDKGWVQFIDWPRYSSGYAALFHTPAFMSETHMLKPYKQRVEANYAFISTIIEHLAIKGQTLREYRAQAKSAVKKQSSFAISWQADKNKPTMIDFKGYEPEYKLSKISGLKRLYYNRNKPFSKKVPYYNNYVADIVIEKPKAYAFSKAWKNIAELMILNGVNVKQFSKSEELLVEVYIIKDYETSRTPYEGHYVHSNVQLKAIKQKVNFSQGDYYIDVNQVGNRYIVETLEPQAKDSFFAWNFFDSHLQKKEYFSPYVFEDYAVEILKKEPQLKVALEAKQKADKAFSENAYAQLDFIYKRSVHHEAEHMRYPIFRITD